MKAAALLTTALLACQSANAQGVITRISAGDHYFYYDGQIQPVFDAASPGDTIILGGGVYLQTVDLVINVPLVLIGTGTRQDSSLAYGGRTVLTGNNLMDLSIASTAD